MTVTDTLTKPVHGLKQSDFTVKEDGKPQKIKNFDEYGADILSQQSAPPPVLPPHVYTNAPPPGLQTGAVNILLLDMLNTGPARQERVREKAITYLKNMPAGTEVAIFELRNGAASCRLPPTAPFCWQRWLQFRPIMSSISTLTRRLLCVLLMELHLLLVMASQPGY